MAIDSNRSTQNEYIGSHYLGRNWNNTVKHERFYDLINLTKSVEPIYSKGSRPGNTEKQRVGTNSLKISNHGPNLVKESATPKSSQTQRPIYLKKSAQNDYIGTHFFGKIKMNILVPNFGYFQVARTKVWAEKGSEILVVWNQFTNRVWEPRRRLARGTQRSLRRPAGCISP